MDPLQGLLAREHPPAITESELRARWEASDDPIAIYLLAGPLVDRVTLVRALMECARLAVPHLPGDPASHAAFDVTAQWLEGAATVEDVDGAFTLTRQAFDAASAAGNGAHCTAINATIGPAAVVLARPDVRALALATC